MSAGVIGHSEILQVAIAKYMAQDYEDNFFEEDTFLERNSRDFVSRIARINTNAETICDVLMQHPRIKQVNYLKHLPSKKHDALVAPQRWLWRSFCPLLSLLMDDAIAFYDNLNTAKGPSLGTNFTLR